MADRKQVASPPDDGHTGAHTTPDQTMAESDPSVTRAPELHRDRQKIIEQERTSPLPIIVGATLLLAFIILAVFMPRF